MPEKKIVVNISDTGEIDAETRAVRLIPKATWHSSRLYHTYGSGKCHIFAFEVR